MMDFICYQIKDDNISEHTRYIKSMHVTYEQNIFLLCIISNPAVIVSFVKCENMIYIASLRKTQSIAAMEASNEKGQRYQILPDPKSLGIHLKSSMTREAY